MWETNKQINKKSTHICKAPTIQSEAIMVPFWLCENPSVLNADINQVLKNKQTNKISSVPVSEI